ncbi:MAG: HutD family protein [Rhodobacteraceae bacterium]|nr:HutD family protein [Paracoccaceae bacterium]
MHKLKRLKRSAVPVQIIHPGAFLRQPWKNGGGVTHEVARADSATPFWRLSIAEVATEGPFSPFPALMRILTVIEGAGMALDTPLGWLNALPMQPVQFSGDLPVRARLLAGPVRDLNLIYDPAQWQARVDPLAAVRCLATPEGGAAFCLCLGDELRLGAQSVPTGSVAALEAGESTLLPRAGAAGLVVLLRPIA